MKRYAASGLLVSLLLAMGAGSCDLFRGPGVPAGAGTLVISLGDGSGAERAITSGAELPAEVRTALRYDFTLTGPGGEVLKETLTAGEGSLTLTIAVGEWRIDTEAWLADGLAGTGSRTFTVTPGPNSLRMPMKINQGYFTITVPSTSGGAVTANFPAAFPGTTITLTVTPDPGYALKAGTLKYNDGSDHAVAEPPYSFAMPAADITMSAEFEVLPPDTYSIVIASMTNGTVTASPVSATAGTTIALTVEPDIGYALKAGTLRYSYGGGDYTPEGSGLVYSFAMPAAHVTVGAEFEALPPDTYSVVIASMTNGTVVADPVSATAGTTIALTVEPDTGYALKAGTLKYNDGSDHDVAGPPYTFTMPAADVTVSAEFKPDDKAAITIDVLQDKAVTVTATHSAGHTPPTEISWSDSESVTFTLDSSEYTAEAGTLKWFMDGAEKTGTGNSLVINARNYVQRRYTLTVMIKEDGQWYSTETDFTVTE